MKFFNYIMLFTTIAVLFYVGGIDVIGVNKILNVAGIVDTDGDININSNSTLRTTIMLLLIGASAIGITISFFTKSKSENYVILPLIIGVVVTTTYINFGWNIISYGFTQADYIGYITLIIFAPLSVGFLWSLVEFFRGTD